jgi:hypothetical protein
MDNMMMIMTIIIIIIIIIIILLLPTQEANLSRGMRVKFQSNSEGSTPYFWDMTKVSKDNAKSSNPSACTMTRALLPRITEAPGSNLCPRGPAILFKGSL